MGGSWGMDAVGDGPVVPVRGAVAGRGRAARWLAATASTVGLGESGDARP
jgi:hypothetical protein